MAVGHFLLGDFLGILRRDFLGIAVVAGCAVHLLGGRLAACTFPADKALLRCRVPCRNLSRNYGGRQGADSNLVAAVSPTVEHCRVLPVIAVVGPRKKLLLLAPYSYLRDAKCLAEVAPAFGQEAARFVPRLLRLRLGLRLTSFVVVC